MWFPIDSTNKSDYEKIVLENNVLKETINKLKNKNIPYQKYEKLMDVNNQLTIENNKFKGYIIIIKDTIIYEADKNQELCLISNFGKKNKLLDNKSILKIYSL